MKVEVEVGTGIWTVYSPKFDYMAYGKTQLEALNNFERGLYETLIEREKMGIKIMRVNQN